MPTSSGFSQSEVGFSAREDPYSTSNVILRYSISSSFHRDHHHPFDTLQIDMDSAISIIVILLIDVICMCGDSCRKRDGDCHSAGQVTTVTGHEVFRPSRKAPVMSILMSWTKFQALGAVVGLQAECKSFRTDTRLQNRATRNLQ